MKILVVEDDSLILKTMQLCLKRDGHEVIGCMDGLEALEKFKEHNPDLVILDIMLPYISGLELVGKIKQESSTIPVIVISAMGQQEVVEEALKLGANEYISKPFNITTLSSQIERLTQHAAIA